MEAMAKLQTCERWVALKELMRKILTILWLSGSVMLLLHLVRNKARQGGSLG
jgi:hypothetical protein